jgi:DNA recombination protein RmuC
MTTFEVAIVAVVAAAVGGLLAASFVRARAAAHRGVAALLEAHSAHIERVVDALGRQAQDDHLLRQGVADTRRAVEDLRSRDQERRDRDEESRASLRRLEATFLGAATRGRTGENVVWETLSLLPPDMVDADFRVGGKVVEFALRLPDGRRLPVDCKWVAIAEVAALDEAEGPDRPRLAQAVERVVAARAREVAKYLDPSRTTPFAVAAVPDAAYAVLRRAHLDAYGDRVLLVPFSGALPVLLALYALCCRLDGEVADIGSMVSEVERSLDAIERSLENSVERAAKMTHNAAGDIRVHIGRARGAVARATDDRRIRPVPPLRAVTSGPTRSE